MDLLLNTPLVSAEWLNDNLHNEKIVILDASFPKVGVNNQVKNNFRIKSSVFFDLKNVFSDSNSNFPNTVLSPKDFEYSAQKIGINKDSIIIVYDDLGIYSSPRVWWMFKLMGFNNIAVLDGGFSNWIMKKYPVEIKNERPRPLGNFKVNYKPQKIIFTKNVLDNLTTEKNLVVDARSKNRFFGIDPEPRKSIKSGHIPKSKNLPYQEVLNQNFLKSKTDLVNIFHRINPENNSLIFSCGSGITASILAFAFEVSGNKNYSVYDGSWTEWGSTENLPIEVK